MRLPKKSLFSHFKVDFWCCTFIQTDPIEAHFSFFTVVFHAKVCLFDTMLSAINNILLTYFHMHMFAFPYFTRLLLFCNSFFIET